MNGKTWFISVLTLISLSMIVPSEAKLVDDLVLCFSFDEGKGDTVKDLSPEGNDGTIQGNLKWVNGKFGKALYFDGSTWVVAPHIPFDNRSFTVQMWVKPEMVSGEELVFSQNQSGSANLSLHFRIYSDSRIRMGFYANDLDAPAGFVKKNEWHNLTFWFDVSDKSRKIYIDGEERASGTATSAYLGTTGNTMIGRWEIGGGQYYHGAIDEVRVWHKPLSEDEIVDSMNMDSDKLMGAGPVELEDKLAMMWSAIKIR
jgi:hypothetical protein